MTYNRQTALGGRFPRVIESAGCVAEEGYGMDTMREDGYIQGTLCSQVTTRFVSASTAMKEAPLWGGVFVRLRLR